MGLFGRGILQDIPVSWTWGVERKKGPSVVPGFRLSSHKDSGPCHKMVLPQDGPGEAKSTDVGRGRELDPSGGERRQLRCH